MKNLIAFLLLLSLAFAGTNLYAQEDGAAEQPATEQPAEEQPAAEQPAEEQPAEQPVSTESVSGHQVLKRQFIDGDWRFMSCVLIVLIFGLALSIERVITLNIASVNTDKLLEKINAALSSGNLNGAKEVCKSTQGPTASILLEGLNRTSEGIGSVEKAIVSYGAVQMGLLERGLIWISLCIAVAPMLGFMGTVIGMIGAFDKIAVANDISPAIVASGIKVALLTTVFGLIAAIILQVFYNYIVSKIDGIVNSMEDASISLVSLLVEHKITK
jgi:biopolymer transport protein ExbB